MGNPEDGPLFEEALHRHLNGAHSQPIKLTTPQELRNIIKYRHPRKAPGPDGIQNIVLQKLPRKAFAFLTVLFNACLALTYFPQEWKHANILPFPKPGKDNRQPQNYRPISLLSAISKVLERVINNRITAHLSKEDLLRPQQFGFRPGHSTTHQITRLTEYITDGFNRGLHTGAVLLDASAAFDTVWTKGLLYKMTIMKFSPELIKLLQSYLTNRTFHVSLDGTRSTAKTVANGTPQGSILGPALFIMYVNDIPCRGRARLAQYADDTTAYHQARSIPELVHHLQQALDGLLEYFHRWRIKINATKTEAILFSKRIIALANEHLLRAGATPLPWLKKTRFLGVILDRRLTFGEHIKHVQRNARAAMAIINPLINRRSKMDKDIKTRLAAAYTVPILTYAAPAWTGIASDTNLQKLQTIQNKFLRTAQSATRLTNTRRLHKEAKLPLIGDSIMKITEKFFKTARSNTNPLIASLGEITPEMAPYRIKHKMPTYRLHQKDA
jgi:hypothetical protein